MIHTRLCKKCLKTFDCAKCPHCIRERIKDKEVLNDSNQITERRD